MAVGYTDIGDDLYRELILDHFRHPRHRGTVDGADATVEATNPVCGDEVCLTWRLSEATISDVAFSGSGCSICMASASMLCDAVQGSTVEAARDLADRFRSMLIESGPADGIGDLSALRGVAAYPVRIKCAVLAWNALLEGLGRTANESND